MVEKGRRLSDRTDAATWILGVALALSWAILVIAIACAKPAGAAERPRTWTALTVYDNGRVAVSEGLRAERTCREILCVVRDKMTCAEKAEVDRAAAEKAKLAAAAAEKLKADYRVDHPCVTKVEKWSPGDAKVTVSRCPLPNGGEQVYNEKGELIMATLGMFSGGMVSTSGVSTYIVKQACFQEGAR